MEPDSYSSYGPLRWSKGAVTVLPSRHCPAITGHAHSEAAVPSAAQSAATLVAASEGAVALSRAQQSIEPFDLVAEQLLDQVRGVVRRNPS
jgi:hypothetical protein